MFESFDGFYREFRGMKRILLTRKKRFSVFLGVHRISLPVPMENDFNNDSGMQENSCQFKHKE